MSASEANATSASEASAISASEASTSARDGIMAGIRQNLPEPPRELPVVPMFDDIAHPGLEDWFRDNLERMGGEWLGSPADPHSLADVDYGIVRCAFAVAETGSVCFTEAELGTNALGYLPQHLIVLLDPRDIVLNIHHAYRRPEFKRAHYATFHTGPSATADIEGVLIHGAQGVRSLSVLLHRRGAVPASS